MGNCDSCIGGREHHPSSPRQQSRQQPHPRLIKNEIQYSNNSDNDLLNYRIVPFDRRPSIKIPDPATEKPPRKHKAI